MKTIVRKPLMMEIWTILNKMKLKYEFYSVYFYLLFTFSFVYSLWKFKKNFFSLKKFEFLLLAWIIFLLKYIFQTSSIDFIFISCSVSVQWMLSQFITIFSTAISTYFASLFPWKCTCIKIHLFLFFFSSSIVSSLLLYPYPMVLCFLVWNILFINLLQIFFQDTCNSLIWLRNGCTRLTHSFILEQEQPPQCVTC